MSKKFAVGILVGVFLITAFAFAENGGQLQPTATVAAAVGQPATAAALPEEAKPAAKPAPKKPALGITYGLDGRARYDVFNNADFTNNVNDESRALRWRNRVFANVPLGENVDGFIRIAQESWKRNAVTLPQCSASRTLYCSPAGTFVTGGVPWSAQNVWVDNAYLDFKKLPGLKNTSLKVGRQDLFRGDGLINLFTGEGGEGPKRGAFDMFVLAHTMGKHKFELMGIWDPATDDFYPTANEKYPAIPMVTPSAVDTLNEMGNVQSIGLYYTGRSMKNTDLDAFYFFIKEYDMPGSNVSYQFQPDRHFNWIGGRVVQRFPSDIVVHGSFAGEIGTQDAMSSAANFGSGTVNYRQVDIRAWGAYAFATKYFPKVKTSPYIRGVMLLYSGSDPKNPNTDGNYDQIFGRFTNHPTPIMAEFGYASPLMSDVIPNETRGEIGSAPAYYTNLKLFGVEAGFTPLKGKVRQLQVVLGYQHQGAFNPFTPNAAHLDPAKIAAGATGTATYLTGTSLASPGNVNAFSTTGTNRMNLVKGDLRFVLYRQLSGFVSIEKNFFGDFYNSSWLQPPATGLPAITVFRNDCIAFRAELNYRFTGFLPFHKLPKI